MTYPLSTSLVRIWAAAGKSAPRDEPISFAQIVEAVGLDDALWCCRVEPQHSRDWRRFAVWCARSVEHLMTDARSVAALDVAERYASGEATGEELAAAEVAAWDAADAARAAARAAAWAAARAAAGDTACWAVAGAAARAAAGATAVAAGCWATAGAAAWDSAWAAQRAAFLQLVTTGTLPPVRQEVTHG